MQNASELERMVNLLSLSADIMRRLASVQEASKQDQITSVANDVETAADRLVKILFPPGAGPQ